MKPTDYLSVAERIALRLCRDAIWSGEHCNWLGWTSVVTQAGVTPAYRSLEFTLDEGLAGIVLFLAEWQACHPDPIIGETARGGLRQLARMAEASAPRSGFHAGHAGAVYTRLRAARLLGDDAEGQAALQALDRLARHAFGEGRPDVYAGTAGVAMLLAQAGRALNSELLTSASRRLADALLEAAVRSQSGCAWPLLPGAQPHVGLALGASGVAVALAEVAVSTRDNHLRDTIVDALRFESGSLPHGDAPPSSASRSGEPPSLPLSWLRGLAGLASARLRLSQLSPGDQPVAEERARALAQVIRCLPAQEADFSLADGFPGIGDTLLAAQRADPDPEFAKATEWIAQLGQARYGSGDRLWACGAPGTGESPGLMHGLAGVGFFYLRLAHPDAVESPLLPDLSALFGRKARLRSPDANAA